MTTRISLTAILMVALLAASACGATPDPADTFAADASDDAGDTLLPQDATTTDTTSPFGPDVWHTRVELGTAQTGFDGKTPPVTFVVPPGTTSFVLSVRGPDAWQYTLAALAGPSNLSIVPKFWLDGGPGAPWLCLDNCVNRIASSPAEAQFLVPNTPLVQVQTGEHTVQVYAFDYVPPQGSVFGQRSPQVAKVELAVDFVGKPAELGKLGRLDVNLCLTGAAGITAAVALEHPRVSAALDEVRERLAEAHLELGEVRAFDVPAEQLIFTHDASADAELSALYRTGAGLPPGLNVFLVDAVQVAAKQGIPTLVLGLAGGIPGPLYVGGPRSGVVLSLQAAPQGVLLGRAMAHEIGHYLGLFHTTEETLSGQTAVHDNLPDTPVLDPDNLMFWLVNDTSMGKLTTQQADVLHHNLWVTPVLETP